MNLYLNNPKTPHLNDIEYTNRTVVIMKILLPLLFTVISFFTSASVLDASDSILKDFGEAPAFVGIDSGNEKFNSSETLKNKIGIVNFFFTSCEGPCPSLMLSIKKIVSKTRCEDAVFVSISVDPDHDTSDVLKKYQQSRGFEKNNWSFISMKEDDLIRLLNDGLKLGSGGEIVNHSTRIVLIDQNSKIRLLLPGMDHKSIDRMLDAIHELCS